MFWLEVKEEYLCLGLADIKVHLLLQRIQVWFLAPTSCDYNCLQFQFQGICPSFWPLQVPGGYACVLQTYMQALIKQTMSVVLRIGPRTLYMLSKVSVLHCEAQNYWEVPAAFIYPFVLIAGLTGLKLLGSSDLLSMGTADSYHCAQHLQCLLSCFVCSFFFF